MRQVFKVCGIVSVVGLLALGLPACGGGGGGGSSTAKATFVMGNDGAKSDAARLLDAALGKNHADDPAGVDVDDIEHLFVDVTQIVLNHAPGSSESEEDDSNTVEVSNRMFDPVTIEIDQGESVTWLWIEQGMHTVTSGCNNCPDEGDLFNELMTNLGSELVIAFPDAGSYPYFSDVQQDIDAGMSGTVIVNAAKDSSQSGRTTYGAKDHGGAHPKIVIPVDLTVDLKDLTVIGEVLSADETIPSGFYTGITLHIENPDLRLVSDPNTPITNIRLTANGRLFIKKHFTIPANDEVIIGIEFGGIHLVQTGGGDYVLTPQLHADVDVLEAEVEVQGMITSLDCGTGMMTIDDNGTIYEVMITMDTVILDENDMMIDCSELNGDEIVEVEGALDASLTIVADEIEVEDV